MLLFRIKKQTSKNVADTTFKITGTKLFVPVVTLSTQEYMKLLKQFDSKSDI